MLWLHWCTQNIHTFVHISNKAVLLSYHLHVHWSSIFNFLPELFLCIYNLANWYKRLSFQSILPFLVSLIICFFWFKVRYMGLVYLNTQEAIEGLLIGLVLIFPPTPKDRSQRRWGEGKPVSGAVRNIHAASHRVCGGPNNYNRNIKDFNGHKPP